ncbi:MAG: TonB family protein [Alphaproteobacteria bacterium]|nr:TonB family protein [Alphaproteobacteria bacterium]
MYEAMRQHAPNSTRITGLGATLLVATLAAYAAVQAGTRIVRAIESPTVLVNLAPKASEPERDRPLLPPTGPTIRLPVPAVDPPLDKKFVYEEPTTPTKTSEVVMEPTGPVKPPPVRIAPKLRPMDKPPYPAASIRGREEGTTSLSLCIDAQGRITSANIAQSSGHSRLDDAALAWVRRARFSPATVDGAPAAICDHTLQYVWNLKTVRN